MRSGFGVLGSECGDALPKRLPNQEPSTRNRAQNSESSIRKTRRVQRAGFRVPGAGCVQGSGYWVRSAVTRCRTRPSTRNPAQNSAPSTRKTRRAQSAGFRVPGCVPGSGCWVLGAMTRCRRACRTRNRHRNTVRGSPPRTRHPALGTHAAPSTLNPAPDSSRRQKFISRLMWKTFPLAPTGIGYAVYPTGLLRT